MPKQENEMPQEDIPQNETQVERPHTPDPDNPLQDNTEYANPNYEMPEEMPHAQPQPTTSNANANCIESPDFQETMKKMTLQVGEVSGYHADTPITIKAEPSIWPTAAFINIHEHPI